MLSVNCLISSAEKTRMSCKVCLCIFAAGHQIAGTYAIHNKHNDIDEVRLVYLSKWFANPALAASGDKRKRANDYQDLPDKAAHKF